MSQGCVSAIAALSQSVSDGRYVHIGERTAQRAIGGSGAGKADQPLSENCEGSRLVSVLHRQPIDGESPDQALPADSAKGKAPSWRPKRTTCPECNQEFQPVHVRQSFCSNEHKAAFHNRATVRGRMLVPVAMAARITRDGCAGDTDTGKRARRDSRRLIDKWAKEDREAGRMSMVEYMRQRHAIGY